MNTSDDRGDLLRPLRDIDGADGPPPRYDVALAMRQGDAIRRRRMSIGAVAAIVVVGAAIGIPLGLPSPQHAEPTPAPSRTVPRLGIAVAVAAQYGTGGSAGGKLHSPYAHHTHGGRRIHQLDQCRHRSDRPLCRDHAYQDVHAAIRGRGDTKQGVAGRPAHGSDHALPGSDNGATDVNASGVVVGSSGSDGAGWVYRNGKVSLLPKFHGVVGTPGAINARGDIIGVVTVGQTETHVIWPAAHPGTVRALLPANLIANTITDTGEIGGSIGPFDEGKPYIGDGNGNGHTLATGLADTQGTVSQIRGHYAVGEGPIFAGRFPTVWNLTTGTLMTYPNISLNSIATDGTIVGAATSSSGGYTSIGLVGRDGQLERLPTGHGDSPQVTCFRPASPTTGTPSSGPSRTPANNDGPYSQVALLWHC